MDFIVNAPTFAKQIADLREAVGWNRMENCYKTYESCECLPASST